MSKVRKAVIPAAGFGTRLYPATKVVKKELFPVVDTDGFAKPFIQLIVQEAVGAGLDHVCIVLQAEDVPVFEAYFKGDLSAELSEKLCEREGVHHQTEQVRALGEHIDFVVQESQEGFGHAVLCARKWVGQEPFLLMLGDHAYISHSERNCSRQLLDGFAKDGRSCVAVDRTPAKNVHLYGTVKGIPIPGASGEYEVERYVEKPSAEYARENLRVEGLALDEFLCLFGQYVLSAEIFDLLLYLMRTDSGTPGEVMFTDALELLRDRQAGHRAVEIDGDRYDIGVPDQYLATLMAFGQNKSSISCL